jgi:hypothetical protein
MPLPLDPLTNFGFTYNVNADHLGSATRSVYIVP